MLKFLLIALMDLSLLPLQAADPPVRRVLFVCTGNFFRSAFAELYFNHLATENRRLPAGDPRRKAVAWVAESRGLDPAQLSPTQRAARMSQYALARLRQLGIPVPADPATRLPAHTPRRLAIHDLERCERVVAMHDASHRPMLRRFLARSGGRSRDPEALLARVTYWNIDDVTATPAVPLAPQQQADRSLDEVQRSVAKLFADL